jgi:hypothetical protein
MNEVKHEIEMARKKRKILTVKKDIGTDFKQRWPKQVETCMRLIAERLQNSLKKDQAVEVSAQEIAHLASALADIHMISNHMEIAAKLDDYTLTEKRLRGEIPTV